MVTPTSELARSDAHLQPLGTVTVQNTSSPFSVNIPATFVSCKDSFISNTSSHEPTFEQEQAIATLQTHQNTDIIAWHTLFQSVEPGLRHKDSPGGLSIQAIHALSALRDCARESLLRWLEPCIYLLLKFHSKLQATDKTNSKPTLSTKCWPFLLQVCSCRLVTADPTTGHPE